MKNGKGIWNYRPSGGNYEWFVVFVDQQDWNGTDENKMAWHIIQQRKSSANKVTYKPDGSGTRAYTNGSSGISNGKLLWTKSLRGQHHDGYERLLYDTALNKSRTSIYDPTKPPIGMFGTVSTRAPWVKETETSTGPVPNDIRTFFDISYGHAGTPHWVNHHKGSPAQTIWDGSGQYGSTFRVNTPSTPLQTGNTDEGFITGTGLCYKTEMWGKTGANLFTQLGRFLPPCREPTRGNAYVDRVLVRDDVWEFGKGVLDCLAGEDHVSRSYAQGECHANRYPYGVKNMFGLMKNAPLYTTDTHMGTDGPASGGWGSAGGTSKPGTRTGRDGDGGSGIFIKPAIWYSDKYRYQTDGKRQWEIRGGLAYMLNNWNPTYYNMKNRHGTKQKPNNIQFQTGAHFDVCSTNVSSSNCHSRAMNNNAIANLHYSIWQTYGADIFSFNPETDLDAPCWSCMSTNHLK
jgi:hypothetical protein